MDSKLIKNSKKRQLEEDNIFEEVRNKRLNTLSKIYEQQKQQDVEIKQLEVVDEFELLIQNHGINIENLQDLEVFQQQQQQQQQQELQHESQQLQQLQPQVKRQQRIQKLQNKLKVKLQHQQQQQQQQCEEFCVCCTQFIYLSIN